MIIMFNYITCIAMSNTQQTSINRNNYIITWWSVWKIPIILFFNLFVDSSTKTKMVHGYHLCQIISNSKFDHILRFRISHRVRFSIIESGNMAWNLSHLPLRMQTKGFYSPHAKLVKFLPWLLDLQELKQTNSLIH